MRRVLLKSIQKEKIQQRNTELNTEFKIEFGRWTPEIIHVNGSKKLGAGECNRWSGEGIKLPLQLASC